MSTAPRPILILTLRRTGGTNLTAGLVARSPWKGATHEPFNRQRVFGYVTRAWESNKREKELRASLSAILSEAQNIKHCVELVPAPVTTALLDAAVTADYRFLFLYRENTVARMLSVEFARRSDIWGPKQAQATGATRRVFGEPLEVDTLIARERLSIARLNGAWRRLEERRVPAAVLSFEDIYAQKREAALRTWLDALETLGLSESEESDRLLLDDLRKTGDQGTRDSYEEFQGVGLLRQKSRALPAFEFARNCS